MLRDTGRHESLHTVPTPSPLQCTVVRMHFDMKVYTNVTVQVRNLDDDAYAYHRQRGESDIAPLWIEAFLANRSDEAPPATQHR